jgi:hypothetical protein
MARRSRYADVKTFEPDPLGRVSFKGLLPRTGARAPGALQHTIVAGERLDQLALGYFNDDRYWWRILDANVGFLCGTDLAVELPTPADENNDPFDRLHMIGRTVLVPPKEG